MNGTASHTNLIGTLEQIDRAIAIRERFASVLDPMYAAIKADKPAEKVALARLALVRVMDNTSAQWWLDRQDSNPKSILLEEIAEVLREAKQGASK